MTANEAAERLRTLHRERKWMLDEDYDRTIEQALAAERRATVERIRERFNHARIDRDADVFAILDEEAAL